MEKNIENIITSKTYLELDQKERELIREWADNEDEYNQLKSVFLATELFKEQQEEELNPTIKQRLDVRFKEKFDRERLVWYNKLWLFLWPENTGVIRKPLLQLAAVGLMVVLVAPFLFQNTSSDQRLAMNEKVTREERGVNKQEHVNDENIEKQNDGELEEKQDIVIPQSELDDLEQTPQMSAPRDSKVIDSKLEEVKKMEDREQETGWTLNNEVAESESIDESVSIESLSASDQMPEQDKDMFAGSVMERDDSVDSERTVLASESESRASYGSTKKVDPEKTIDLLTALF